MGVSHDSVHESKVTGNIAIVNLSHLSLTRTVFFAHVHNRLIARSNAVGINGDDSGTDSGNPSMELERYPQLPSAILGILVEFDALYSARIFLGTSCKLPMAGISNVLR